MGEGYIGGGGSDVLPPSLLGVGSGGSWSRHHHRGMGGANESSARYASEIGASHLPANPHSWATLKMMTVTIKKPQKSISEKRLPSMLKAATKPMPMMEVISRRTSTSVSAHAGGVMVFAFAGSDALCSGAQLAPWCDKSMRREMSAVRYDPHTT